LVREKKTKGLYDSAAQGCHERHKVFNSCRSLNFVLSRFVSNNLRAPFRGLVIIKLERALFEFYGSLDVGLNLSVRKLQYQ